MCERLLWCRPTRRPTEFFEEGTALFGDGGRRMARRPQAAARDVRSTGLFHERVSQLAPGPSGSFLKSKRDVRPSEARALEKTPPDGARGVSTGRATSTAAGNATARRIPARSAGLRIERFPFSCTQAPSRRGTTNRWLTVH